MSPLRRFTFNENLQEDEIEEGMQILDDAAAKFKAISDTLAQASEPFCNGYASANREAVEAGRVWSEQCVEKIALLRLAERGNAGYLQP